MTFCRPWYLAENVPHVMEFMTLIACCGEILKFRVLYGAEEPVLYPSIVMAQGMVARDDSFVIR